MSGTFTYAQFWGGRPSSNDKGGKVAVSKPRHFVVSDTVKALIQSLTGSDEEALILDYDISGDTVTITNATRATNQAVQKSRYCTVAKTTAIQSTLHTHTLKGASKPSTDDHEAAAGCLFAAMYHRPTGQIVFYDGERILQRYKL